MKYRIVKTVYKNYIVQYKYKYIPFWFTAKRSITARVSVERYFRLLSDAKEYVEILEKLETYKICDNVVIP